MTGAMGTDLWTYTRQSFVDFFRRRRSADAAEEAEVLGRLDSLEQAIAALEPDQRPLIASGVQAPVREILASCFGNDQPEALREFLDALQAHGVEAPVSAQQTVTGNFALGSINVAGRDNNFGGNR